MPGRPALSALTVTAAFVLAVAACGGADEPSAPTSTRPPTATSLAPLPSTTTAPTTLPSDDPASYIGLDLDAAGARADEQGRPWRVVRQDGEDLIVTADFNPNRLNFTVDDGVVTDAVTDADMIAANSPDTGCESEALDSVTDYEAVGRQDIDGDGSDELFVLTGQDEIGIFAVVDCEATEVRVDDAPARFTVGIDDTAAGGVVCQEEFVDDLYVTTLSSSDGEVYSGRTAGYDLDGSVLTEIDGEGTETDRSGAEAMAGLDCGAATYPLPR